MSSVQIRVAQWSSAAIVALFGMATTWGYHVSGAWGGIYGNALAPLWIASPAIFGLFVLRTFRRERSLFQRHILERRSRAFLWAAVIDFGSAVFVNYALSGSADYAVSFALYLLLTPLVFFVAYAVAYAAVGKLDDKS